MLRLEKSIEVDAPVEQVFAYLVDPAHLPEYETGGGEVKNIQRLPDGRYTYTEVSKLLGIHSESKGEQVEVVPNERIVWRDEGGGMDSTMTERFERLPEGKTSVTVVSETTLHAGPFAKFGEAFFAKYFDRGIEMAMEAAKARIEAGIPTGASR
ncbi:MAG TPA: SRPBCC family protein [Ktedonobacterales bacterium]|nr:SRPBCC family protein [Ktedonobacterales bacterium]